MDGYCGAPSPIARRRVMTTYSRGDAVITDYGAAFICAVRDGSEGQEVAVEIEGRIVWLHESAVQPL